MSNSFFDFTSPFQLEKPVEIFQRAQRGQFYIPKGDNFKLKTLVLQRNQVILASKNKTVKKYYNVTNAQLQIVNHQKMGRGIQITKNNSNFVFYGEIDEWYDKLKKQCLQTNFQSEYCMIKLLGRGSFAKVYKIQRLSDKAEFAVKLFDKTTLQQQDKSALLKEIEILRLMNHKNVISILETYENEQYIFIVQELYSGGELNKQLKKQKVFNEYGAFKIISQILDALKYIHAHGVLHRDIKPENIILKEEDNIEEIVLADFGLADYYRKDCRYMFTRCGTPGYVAPEVLQDKLYDYKVDIYSLGILFYILLVGKGPFETGNYDQIVMQNFNGFIDFSKLNFSYECLELMKGMLDSNPTKRLTIEQIQQSAFYKKYSTSIQLGSSTSLSSLPTMHSDYSLVQSPKPLIEIKSRFVTSRSQQPSPLTLTSQQSPLNQQKSPSLEINKSPLRLNKSPSPRLISQNGFSPLVAPFKNSPAITRVPIQI